jgi:hypothetical protein
MLSPQRQPVALRGGLAAAGRLKDLGPLLRCQTHDIRDWLMKIATAQTFGMLG